MSQERRGDGSGAIVLILLVLALLALLVVGGGGAFVFYRMNVASQMAMMEARMQAEMAAVQAERARAEMEAQLAARKTAENAQAVASAPEIVLEIDAAGNYTLAGKAMEYYDDLKAALLAAHIEKGDHLQVIIRADKEVKFDRVTKAIEAAECAGINKHRIATTVQPAP